MCTLDSEKCGIYGMCIVPDHDRRLSVWVYTHKSLLILVHVSLSLGVHSNIERARPIINLNTFSLLVFYHAYFRFFCTSLKVLTISNGICFILKCMCISRCIAKILHFISSFKICSPTVWSVAFFFSWALNCHITRVSHNHRVRESIGWAGALDKTRLLPMVTGGWLAFLDFGHSDAHGLALSPHSF